MICADLMRLGVHIVLFLVSIREDRHREAKRRGYWAVDIVILPLKPMVLITHLHSHHGYPSKKKVSFLECINQQEKEDTKSAAPENDENPFFAVPVSHFPSPNPRRLHRSCSLACSKISIKQVIVLLQKKRNVKLSVTTQSHHHK